MHLRAAFIRMNVDLYFFTFLNVPTMIMDEMVLSRLTALLAVIALCYAIKVMSENIIIIHGFYQSYFYLEAPLYLGITAPMIPWGMQTLRNHVSAS